MDAARREQLLFRLDEMSQDRAVGDRRPDAALLLWFLQHVERLDPVESEDAVIERSADVEFDGVWVDELSEQVTLLEAKHFSAPADLGQEEIGQLLASAARLNDDAFLSDFSARQFQPEVQGLLNRQRLRQLLDSGYSLRLLAVTNGLISPDAKAAFRAAHSGEASTEIWDLEDLALYVEYADRPLYIRESVTLDFAPDGVFSVSLPGSAPVTFGALSASQIASLPGIGDRTLFAQNVRLDLGRTRVNKDLATTVADGEEHSRFLTFHNGLTILCRTVARDPNRAERFVISGFSVVNGCQSALAFYDNREKLTPDLLVPVRLVQVGDTARLADDITYRSNNQNSISLKDLRANDSTQIQLQSEFHHLFGQRVGYQIKRGETIDADVVIGNDLAAQILLALYVQEPWQSHRKSALFAEWYKRIFRPNIRAPHIYLAYLMWEEANVAKEELDDPLLAGYGLTVFVLVSLAGRLMSETAEGKEILAQPLGYLQDREAEVRKAIRLLLKDIVVDLDAYVREESEGGYFDYESRFKSQSAIRHLTEDVLRSHKKAVNRDPLAAFHL
jgi:hypothetical protein